MSSIDLQDVDMFLGQFDEKGAARCPAILPFRNILVIPMSILKTVLSLRQNVLSL
jgi:hypothetical protein